MERVQHTPESPVQEHQVLTITKLDVEERKAFEDGAEHDEKEAGADNIG